MNAEKLKRAIELSEKGGSIFVGTADKMGNPHIAAAANLSGANENYASVTEWFCSGSVSNLEENKNLSIVVWDKDIDLGYQFSGRLEKIVDLGVLDGYLPGEESGGPMPQVRRELLVRVEKITDFKLGPHSDVEE